MPGDTYSVWSLPQNGRRHRIKSWSTWVPPTVTVPATIVLSFELREDSSFELREDGGFELR